MPSTSVTVIGSLPRSAFSTGVVRLPPSGSFAVSSGIQFADLSISRADFVGTDTSECLQAELQIAPNGSTTFQPWVSIGVTDDGAIEPATGLPYAVSRVRVSIPSPCSAFVLLTVTRPKTLSLQVGTE